MTGRIDLDEALGMWLAGYRYRSIAERFGVSRQAVEQMRDRYPEFFPTREWTTPAEAGAAVQVSQVTLSRWIVDGLLPTSPDGLVRVVDAEAVIAELWTRRCEYLDCEREVEDIALGRRFCAEHSCEVRRYRYPVMTREERRRAHEATDRWRAANPERAREIRLRAGRAYRERQRERAS